MTKNSLEVRRQGVEQLPCPLVERKDSLILVETGVTARQTSGEVLCRDLVECSADATVQCTDALYPCSDNLEGGVRRYIDAFVNGRIGKQVRIVHIQQVRYAVIYASMSTRL